MVASGMGFINNGGYTTDYLGELKLASIQMLSKNKCKSLEFPGSLLKGNKRCTVETLLREISW